MSFLIYKGDLFDAIVILVTRRFASSIFQALTSCLSIDFSYIEDARL